MVLCSMLNFDKCRFEEQSFTIYLCICQVTDGYLTNWVWYLEVINYLDLVELFNSQRVYPFSLYCTMVRYVTMTSLNDYTYITWLFIMAVGHFSCMCCLFMIFVWDFRFWTIAVSILQTRWYLAFRTGSMGLQRWTRRLDMLLINGKELGHYIFYFKYFGVKTFFIFSVVGSSFDKKEVSVN